MAEIRRYRPEYKQPFIDLNTAWLNEFFEVEEHDRQIFNNVENLIIRPGGEIFFCVSDNIVVGTVAMQKLPKACSSLQRWLWQNHSAAGDSQML